MFLNKGNYVTVSTDSRSLTYVKDQWDLVVLGLL